MEIDPTVVRELMPVAPAAAPEPARCALSAGDVLSSWESEGPLVHTPTGLPKLDELTGGGPPWGCRVVLNGAPDAGKTALIVQVCDVQLELGHAAAVYAVDEEPSDVLGRFMQRRGFAREVCEKRERLDMLAMRDRASEELRHLRLYDASWTIESAATDFAAYCAANGLRGIFAVDSVQTIRSDAEAGSASERENLDTRVRALRTAATKHRLLVVATSEMNRGAYRSTDAAEQTNDMAASKGSGSIEYQARLLISLRSVAGEPDTIEARIVKNKLGPAGESIALRLNRRLMTLEETDGAKLVAAEERRSEAKITKAKDANLRDAAVLAEVLAGSPALTVWSLRAPMRARLGQCSSERIATAVHLLGPAAVASQGRKAGSEAYSLDGQALPPEVFALVAPEARARVLASRTTGTTTNHRGGSAEVGGSTRDPSREPPAAHPEGGAVVVVRGGGESPVELKASQPSKRRPPGRLVASVELEGEVAP